MLGVLCFELNGEVWDSADLRRVALPVVDVVSLKQTDLPRVESLLMHVKAWARPYAHAEVYGEN